MEPEALSDLIRDAFRVAVRPEVAAANPAQDLEVCGVAAIDLAVHVRRRDVPLPVRDRIWSEVVRRYRQDAGGFWAAVLLEMLAPGLVTRIARVRWLTDAVSPTDLRQQLIADALETAATIPLPDPPSLIERRLVLRTLNRTTRWLEKERRTDLGAAPWTPDIDVELDRRAHQDWLATTANSEYPLSPKQGSRRRPRRPARLRGKQ